MKEEKRYIFTEEDYKLLRKPLPKSPHVLIVQRFVQVVINFIIIWEQLNRMKLKIY